jgi:hypothetical protein
MDNFSSGFARKKCKNLEKFPLGAFWGIFWFLGHFQNFIFFYFL